MAERRAAFSTSLVWNSPLPVCLPASPLLTSCPALPDRPLGAALGAVSAWAARPPSVTPPVSTLELVSAAGLARAALAWLPGLAIASTPAAADPASELAPFSASAPASGAVPALAAPAVSCTGPGARPAPDSKLARVAWTAPAWGGVQAQRALPTRQVSPRARSARNPLEREAAWVEPVAEVSNRLIDVAFPKRISAARARNRVTRRRGSLLAVVTLAVRVRLRQRAPRLSTL